MILIDISGTRKKIIIAVAFFLIAACIYGAFMMEGVQTSTEPKQIKYKDYIGYGGKFTYKLPAEWRTEEQKFEGNEILYHNDFISGDNKFIGFVQLWNLNIPLKKFLDESKDSAYGVINFKEYTIEPVKIKGREGYILEYIREVEGGKYIKAFEIFVMDNGNIFERFAFYMDEKTWKNDYKMFFLNIASTGELK